MVSFRLRVLPPGCHTPSRLGATEATSANVPRWGLFIIAISRKKDIIVMLEDHHPKCQALSSATELKYFELVTKWVFPKNRGKTTKMDGENNGTPLLKFHGFGGFYILIFGSTPI